MRRTTTLTLAALALVACRPDSSGGDSGACSSNEDCDDGIECTVDSCGVGGSCSYTTVNESCPDGQTCVEGVGCQDAGCTSAEACDDEIDCTIDNCAVGGECTHTAVDDLCGGEEQCVEGIGCQLVGCSSPDQCDDGIECTIDDCGVDHECAHTPLDDMCEGEERCIVEYGCVGQCESPDDCDDGDFCNGDERCQLEFGCLPPEEPRDCNDNDECTIDSCDSDANRCVYEVNAAIAGCDEFEIGDLNGCFDITPEVGQDCIVHYSFTQVCFEMVGPVLTATAGRFELTQNPGPTDEHFNVTLEISGGCTERYTLSGTFSGSSTFSGTWASEFINVDGFSCWASGCRNLTIPVTATRRP